MSGQRRTSRSIALLASAATAALVVGSMPAEAGPNNNTSKKLRQAVTLAGLTDHLEAFQAIADANGGNRFSGLPGHDASVDYAVDVFEAAGYRVTVQPFVYTASASAGPSDLTQIAPGAAVYAEGVDYQTIGETDAGDITAAVTPVDLQLGLGNASSSGCEAADFAGFPAGNIALLQRGTCTFAIKATNAAAAGAVGALIMNQGNDPTRTGLINGTLGADNTSGIPVMELTYDLGAQFAATPGLVLRLFANVVRGDLTTYNVFAESRTGDPANVVMAGAHLDSVDTGPGINDNGTGSAAILEVAEQLAKTKPKNKLRFALWGAEESGLIGAQRYIDSLSAEEQQRIALYLNFDMVGSPNYVRFVYDGDNSAFPVGPGSAEGPAGSGAIEQLFHDYFAGQGLASAETAFSGRSDYGPFIDVGIPAGGLFTGAEGVKTAEEAAIFGGTAGQAYDPCYHQACDTLANINGTGFHEMSDAVAHAILTYAMDTRSVNGSGKGHPVSPPGQNVTGTPTTAAGDGGDHDHAGAVS